MIYQILAQTDGNGLKLLIGYLTGLTGSAMLALGLVLFFFGYIVTGKTLKAAKDDAEQRRKEDIALFRSMAEKAEKERDDYRQICVRQQGILEYAMGNASKGISFAEDVILKRGAGNNA